jgi:glycosyltransferase involved in cell wall biosynthesis
LLPRVTVVTPSYNQARFLDETLRSVLCQRDQIHEFFVLDGGSADGSVDVIRRYERQIDFWTSEKDRGQSDAIDKGFARATGDILFWLNSDDVLTPGAIARVRKAMADHPDWDVVTGNSVHIDGQSRILSVHRVPRESWGMMRRGVIHVTQQTCFFKRELYSRVGGLNHDLHWVMDIELWLRMGEAGARWGHLPNVLGAFREHAESKGAKWKREYQEEHDYLKKQYPEFYGGPAHRVARLLYGMSQFLSGKHPRARLETRRLRGRLMTEVYGDWTVRP